MEEQSTTKVAQSIQALRSVFALAARQKTPLEKLDLFTDPISAAEYAHHIEQLLLSSNWVTMWTDVGLHGSRSFFGNILYRLQHRILPPLPDESSMAYVLGEVFRTKSSAEWALQQSNEAWISWMLRMEEHWSQTDHVQNRLLRQCNDALFVLSQRIASFGVREEFLRRNKTVSTDASPFLMQQLEWTSLAADEGTSNDLRPLNVMLNQCLDVLQKNRKEQERYGASLSYTYALLGCKQQIERFRQILSLRAALLGEDIQDSPGRLFKTLIRALHNRFDLTDPVHDSVALLSLQITEQASRTGEHYISTDRAGYFAMLRSALKGGAVVGLLSVFKSAIYYLHLAPLWQAVSYSLNYGLGFIGIHLMHGTIATKQPAMTATKLASALDIKSDQAPSLDAFATLIVHTLRTQFIALAGNVALSFPVALVFSVCWAWVKGSHVVTESKAHHLLGELHPFTSLALPHAALAGMYLFIAGLISGYVDNLNRSENLAKRIGVHPKLVLAFGPRRMNSVAHYLHHALGSLIGNFVLGCLLGSTAFVGLLLGWPLDIRHITFSAGNFGLATATLYDHISAETVFFSLLGILLIGLTNLAVSFGLSIWVATRARGIRFGQTSQLIRLLSIQFFNNPRQFFLPPSSCAHSKTPS